MMLSFDVTVLLALEAGSVAGVYVIWALFHLRKHLLKSSRKPSQG